MDFPSTIPTEALRYLISILTGGEEFNTRKAVHAGWLVSGYLINITLPESPSMDISEVKKLKIVVGKDRINKKKITKALSDMLPAEEGEVKAAFNWEDYKWLLPIILNLIEKWMSGKK